MTDLELFQDMLVRNTISYTKIVFDETIPDKGAEIELETKTTGVEGYIGFFTTFAFDKLGKLMKVEVWES